MSLTLSVTALCATAAPAGAAAPRETARASGTGSLVYQQGGNIWVASPDGSRKHKVTRNGKPSNPYEYATQADNGTIEALRGYKLVHMKRNGKVIGPQPKVATGPNNQFSLHTLAFSPAISPNGKTVAVSILEYQGVYDPSTGGRGANLIAQTIEYRSTTTGKRMSQRHLAGTYLQSPSWIDNTHVVMFAPYNIAAAQVYVDGPKLDGWNWFSDPQSGDFDFDRQSLNQGELTRKRDMLALVRGPNLKNDWRSTSVQIYAVSGLHSTPTPMCSVAAKHGVLGKVTWSPNGSTLAWSDASGIWESAVQPGSPNCGLQPRLVIAGGANPDWGPAGV